MNVAIDASCSEIAVCSRSEFTTESASSQLGSVGDRLIGNRQDDAAVFAIESNDQKLGFQLSNLLCGEVNTPIT